eukprot:scaffold225641_cov30-Tisochrysis_lutea.AAC.3
MGLHTRARHGPANVFSSACPSATHASTHPNRNKTDNGKHCGRRPRVMKGVELHRAPSRKKEEEQDLGRARSTTRPCAHGLQ